MLAVPLSCEQVEAAKRLHEQLPGWQLVDQALAKLANRIPGFGLDAVLLKSVAVNTLYGTSIIAIYDVAEHVAKVISQTNLATAGPKLVEILGGQVKGRTNLVFASKFAHFFIDPARFPMLDSYAEQMVKLHLGQAHMVKDEGGRYEMFCTNLTKLRELAQLQCGTRELDYYLWLAGQYRAWKRKPSVKINSETKELFRNPSPHQAQLLAILVP
jgi:hypothetical protein